MKQVTVTTDWTPLFTAGDVISTFSLQVERGSVSLMATTSETPPADPVGTVIGQGSLLIGQALADWFPSMGTSATKLYARAVGGASASVLIDY